MSEVGPRAWFELASTGVLAVVDAISSEQLDRPGLGEWDVRSLLGHTSRAFVTLVDYVGREPGPDVELVGTAGYYAAARALPSGDAAVAERGRAAGRALGDDPWSAVHAAADRALRVVDESADDTPAVTPFGTLALADYLPTRALELTVHGLDLARATEQDPPPGLVEACVPAVALCARIAPGQAPQVLLALTGRTVLAPGFSLL